MGLCLISCFVAAVVVCSLIVGSVGGFGVLMMGLGCRVWLPVVCVLGVLCLMCCYCCI